MGVAQGYLVTEAQSFDYTESTEGRMGKQTVITRLCELVSLVGAHLKHKHAHDCFCEMGEGLFDPQHFQFEPEVLDYIKSAIYDKLATVNAARDLRRRQARLRQRAK